MKSSLFQTILLVVCGVFVLLAVLIFSGAIPIGKKTAEEKPKGTVMVWGLLPKDKLQTLIDGFNRSHQGITVIYNQVDASVFDQTLAESIATGTGPDILFLPQDMILRQAAKAYKIPYESFAERDFRDTYVQEGELLLAPDGIIGIPLIIDPMILYYNRNLFEAAGFTTPPKNWEELLSMVPALTKRVAPTNAITQSAVALGAYTNVDHAKDILSMLLIQAGNPIVANVAGKYLSVIANNGQQSLNEVSSGVAVLTFFTQFADSRRDTYTWNKSLPRSSDAFINENVVFYFGYASELPYISNRNPNLNFDVAKMPQIKDAKSQMTFGKMTSVVLMKTSKNFNTAKYVQELMAQKEFVDALVSAIGSEYPVAPARRDLLGTPQKNLLGPALYNSALIARAWLDPSDVKTATVFKTMVEDVIRGAASIPQALADANNKLTLILQ